MWFNCSIFPVRAVSLFPFVLVFPVRAVSLSPFVFVFPVRAVSLSPFVFTPYFCSLLSVLCAASCATALLAPRGKAKRVQSMAPTLQPQARGVARSRWVGADALQRPMPLNYHTFHVQRRSQPSRPAFPG